MSRAPCVRKCAPQPTASLPDGGTGRRAGRGLDARPLLACRVRGESLGPFSARTAAADTGSSRTPRDACFSKHDCNGLLRSSPRPERMRVSFSSAGEGAPPWTPPSAPPSRTSGRRRCRRRCRARPAASSRSAARSRPRWATWRRRSSACAARAGGRLLHGGRGGGRRMLPCAVVLVAGGPAHARTGGDGAARGHGAHGRSRGHRRDRARGARAGGARRARARGSGLEMADRTGVRRPFRESRDRAVDFRSAAFEAALGGENRRGDLAERLPALVVDDFSPILRCERDTVLAESN